MADIVQRYMTVKMIWGTNAMSFDCWLSTADFWAHERHLYPHDYTYIGGRCTWLIHSNHELTQKVIAVIGEQADKMCSEGVTINAKRKVANR